MQKVMAWGCVYFPPEYTTINQALLAAGACRTLKVVPLNHSPHTLIMLLSHNIKFSLNTNDTYVKVLGEPQTAKHIPYVETDK